MATHFQARIYGEIEGHEPFSAISRVISYDYQNVVSFANSVNTFYPLPTGLQMANGAYCYAVIQQPPTGLNVHGAKLVTDLSASALNTLANA